MLAALLLLVARLATIVVVVAVAAVAFLVLDNVAVVVDIPLVEECYWSTLEPLDDLDQADVRAEVVDAVVD